MNLALMILVKARSIKRKEKQRQEYNERRLGIAGPNCCLCDFIDCSSSNSRFNSLICLLGRLGCCHSSFIIVFDIR